MDIAELNNIAANAYLPRRSWNDLVENQSYMVTEIRKVNTRYGEKVVFVINEGAGQFQIFVPGRVSNALYSNDELYNNLSAKANKLELFILYLGNSKFKFV